MEGSVRLLGLVGLFFITFMWDTAVMIKDAETHAINSTTECLVSRSSQKAGFHREITTEVTVSEKTIQDYFSDDKVQYYVKENIPSGLYIDLYQTRAAEDFGGPQVYSSVDIDLEAPEYLSPAHTVHVFSTLHHNGDNYVSTVMLPIHLRYHKPSRLHTHDQIHLEPPQIFIIFPDEMSKNSSYVYEESVCNSNGNTMCTWKKLTCIFNSDNGVLRFDVPVGQLDQVTIVTSITLAVTILATLFLTYSIMTKKKENTKKD